MHLAGFNTFGHCYYMENGVEERNVIDRNLAAYVHPIETAGSSGGQRVSASTLQPMSNNSNGSGAAFRLTSCTMISKQDFSSLMVAPDILAELRLKFPDC